LALANDTQSGLITIPFTFNFFGTNYTQLNIGSNLLVGFGPSSVADPNNQNLPNAAVPNNLIAAAWDDHQAGGTIQYFTVGTSPYRIFVIDFDAVPRQGGLYTTTSQIQLYESTNVIEIHTTSAAFGIGGNLATQGIENGAGNVAYVPTGRNNTGWNATNDFVSFVPVCLDIQSVTIDDVPTTASAGSNIIQCNNSVFTLAANTPTVGTGLWSVVGVDPGITITNPSLPNTTVTGLTAGNSVQMRWTISNGICTPSTSDIVLTNEVSPIANAGSGGDVCGIGVGNPFTFTGVASIGTGTWTQISGPGVSTFSDINDPLGTVTVSTAGSYVYRWTEVSGSCSDFDEITVNFFSPLTVQAGNDQVVCNGASVTLGNSPTAIGGDGNFTYSWTSVPIGYTSSTSNPIIIR